MKWLQINKQFEIKFNLDEDELINELVVCPWWYAAYSRYNCLDPSLGPNFPLADTFWNSPSSEGPDQSQSRIAVRSTVAKSRDLLKISDPSTSPPLALISGRLNIWANWLRPIRWQDEVRPKGIRSLKSIRDLFRVRSVSIQTFSFPFT